MPEKFALEETLRQGGAIDGDEGSRGPGAPRVDRLRNELFAATTLSADEHRCFAPRDPRNELEGLGHLRARTHHSLEVLVGLNPPEPAHLFAKRPFPDRAIERQRQIVRVQRLGHVVVRPRAYGAHSGIEAPEGRHDDDRDVSTGRDDASTHLDARGPRHVEVGQNRVDVVHAGSDVLEGLIR